MTGDADRLPPRLWWVLAGLTLAWGFNWSAMKIALAEVTPWVFRSLCLGLGCAVLFLNWMRFQLGYSWTQIIAAGDSTLAKTYQNLTGQTDGYALFMALMDRTYPRGTPSGLTTDNLGAMVGRQTPILAVVVPLILVFIVDGRRGLRNAWLPAITCGLAFAR